MNEQEKRHEEAARLDRQQSEQHATEGRQLTERQLTEERRRQDTQRQENQRREDDRRREDERRRQEQHTREEQRKQESRNKEDSQRADKPREQGGESSLHESTARTMQDGKDSKDGRVQSEQSTIEYARKNGVPIAPASLSMSGRSQNEGKPLQGEKPQPAEQKKTAKPEAQKNPEKGGFAARREAESVNGPLAVLDEYYGKYVTCPGDAQYRLDWIKKYYTPYMNFKYCVPNVFMSADDTEKLSDLSADIQKCINTHKSDFIMNGFTDKDWNSYLSDLKGYKLDEYIGLYQKYFDSYFSNVKE